jgi:hypothetical protein
MSWGNQKERETFFAMSRYMPSSMWKAWLRKGTFAATTQSNNPTTGAALAARLLFLEDTLGLPRSFVRIGADIRNCEKILSRG